MRNVKNVKSLNTRYKGYNFRSRLEARWAVFFEELDLLWKYEPNGFKLPSGRSYLPDFHLVKEDIWLEVKPILDSVTTWPEHPGFDAESLFSNNFYVLKGRPYLEYSDIGLGPKMDSFSEQTYMAWPGYDMGYYFCECPECGTIGISFEGRANRLPCGCLDKEYHNPTSRRLLRAYAKAAEARFEHHDKDKYAV